MSEQEAIATCQNCESSLDQDDKFCPQCGIATPNSTLGKKPNRIESDMGRPVFSMMPGRSGMDISLGPRRLLSDGEKLGNQYQIVEPLGVGGFGEVYLADDLTLGRKVALKIVEIAADRTEIAQQQIIQEFEIREKISDRQHIINGYPPHTLKHKGLSLMLLPMEQVL